MNINFAQRPGIKDLPVVFVMDKNVYNVLNN